MVEKEKKPAVIDSLTDLLPPEHVKKNEHRLSMLVLALPMIFMWITMGLILWYPEEMFWFGIGENIYEIPLFFFPLMLQMIIPCVLKLSLYPKLGGKVNQMLTLYPTVDGIILDPYHMVIKMDESGKLAAEEIKANLRDIINRKKRNLLSSAPMVTGA